jgi:hypothetical protein
VRGVVAASFSATPLTERRLQIPVQQKSSRGQPREDFRKTPLDYGVGLATVVVVVVELLGLEADGDEVVVLVIVLVSLVFSLVAGGFTTVVLFSVFFSAGEAAGVFTVSVFCSHAAKSAALAKMQNSFFIVVD